MDTETNLPGAQRTASRRTDLNHLAQRPAPPISIDVHTHWAPDEYMKLKAEFGQPDLSNPNNANLEQRAKEMD